MNTVVLRLTASAREESESSPHLTTLFSTGIAMSFNSKKSSDTLASQAAVTLRDGGSSNIARRLAASVLSQAQPGNQTGKTMETTASQVLRSSKYSDDTKALAASVVSQANKLR